MKIISTLSSIKKLDSYKGIVDGLIVGSNDFSYNNPVSFSFEELDEILLFCTKNSLLFILNCNLFLYDKKIDDLKKYIKRYDSESTLYIFQDMGVLKILKDMNLNLKSIYDSYTLITNHYDLNLVSALGIDSVSISKEIPIRDAITIKENTKTKVFYKIYGYHQMFVSRRELVSLYVEEKKLICKDLNNLRLKEEKREEFYPIVQNDFLTVIYRDYPLNDIEYVNSLLNMDYLFIDGNLCDEKTFLQVLKIYSLTIRQKMSVSDAKNSLLKLNIPFNEGFQLQDTMYVKEATSR